MIKKLLKWLVKKAYDEELNTTFNIIQNQRNQIKNLKERLKYAETTNIFNFEERKYRNEHL